MLIVFVSLVYLAFEKRSKLIKNLRNVRCIGGIFDQDNVGVNCQLQDAPGQPWSDGRYSKHQNWQRCVLILLIRLVDFHDCFKCLMFFLASWTGWGRAAGGEKKMTGARISPLSPHPLFIIVTNEKGNLFLIWLNLTFIINLGFGAKNWLGKS